MAAPIFIIVEPERADCLFQSAYAGRPTRASGDLDTIMAGLSCGEVSEVAWRIIHAGAEYFMTIPDSVAIECMRLLARGVYGDPALVAGESAVAGLGGLLTLSRGGANGDRLDLSPKSRVLLIGTEGATDPDLYRKLVGSEAIENEAAR